MEEPRRAAWESGGTEPANVDRAPKERAPVKLRKRYDPIKEGIRSRLRREADQKNLRVVEKLRAEADQLLQRMQERIDASGARSKKKDD